MLDWAWREFCFGLPEDWELLQYSSNPLQGRCAFADRYRFRFEFNWRTVPGPPDFGRMLSDYGYQLETELEMRDTRREHHNSWHGISGRHGDSYSARYGRHFNSCGILIELVFLWPATPDRLLEHAVLDSCGYEGADAHGSVHWRACGLDMRVPGDLTLQEIAIAPARAHFAFRATGSEERLCFSRLGMVDCWLNSTPADWLRRQADQRAERLTPAVETVKGHTIERLRGEYKPRGLLRRRRRYESACWRCPDDRRLYQLERIADQRADTGATRPWELLSCCAALGGEA